MEIVAFLIPVSLVLVTGGIILFNWAVKSGQYDDLDGPAHQILYDDDAEMIPEESRQPKNKTGAADRNAADSKSD